jgi:hypothetical protein
MKKTFSSSLSLLSTIPLIAVACGLDLWTDALKQVAQTGFTVISSWLFPATLANLIFAGLLLTWLWFIYFKTDPDRIVSSIFVLLGLGLLFYNYIISITSLHLPLLLMFIPKSLSSFASAILALVGLHKLIFQKP